MNNYKFRAINTITKEWIESEHLIYSDGKWYGEYGDFIDGISLSMASYAVMQYSGVLDRDGKDVCDGDIIMYYGRNGIGIFKVINENGAFLLIDIEHNEDCTIMDNWKDIGVNWRVMGNIYDNKHLLEISE